ncbi:uncharacterized protein P884DRAFT_277825 [Thermothelomyces heterothallicus CBS 202.75]|uniref:uncharacterized protein n=1 Tax=Thermothelomyces heterothallicus CBS 202.75 TaxID=1149848 RepID=UPI0037440AF4
MGPWSRRRSRRNTVSRLARHRDNSVLADRKAVSESGDDDDGDLPGLGKGRGKGKGGPDRFLPSTSSSDASSPSTEPFTQPPASETTTSSDTTTTDFSTTSALFEPPESTSLPLVSTQLSQPLPPIETQSAIAPTPTSSVPELSPVLSTVPSGTTTTASFPTIPASQGSIGRNDLDAQQIAGIVVGSSGKRIIRGFEKGKEGWGGGGQRDQSPPSPAAHHQGAAE